MFGFVNANVRELTPEQKTRYNSVYCGICRQIRLRTSSAARLGLRYDMAFLALLHMSLYEPEESAGKRACGLHPLRPRPWVDNDAVQYAADMNVALAYYKSRDDWQDDAHLGAKVMAGVLGKHIEVIPGSAKLSGEILKSWIAWRRKTVQTPMPRHFCSGS